MIIVILFKKLFKNSEFTSVVKTKICSAGDYGINWVYNHNNKIVLYYESGEKTSRGTLQLLKSYFFGYYKTKDGFSEIVGVIISGPIVLSFIILSLLFEFFIDTDVFLCSFMFYIPILLWIYFGEKKNRIYISDYLKRL